jgi:hypothetical protein
MWLDHIHKAVFKTHFFKKPLYYAVFAKVALLKNSPAKESFLTRSKSQINTHLTFKIGKISYGK